MKLNIAHHAPVQACQALKSFPSSHIVKIFKTQYQVLMMLQAIHKNVGSAVKTSEVRKF